MKILLVNPPNCGRSIPEERYGITSMKQIFKGEPLSLEVLAASLLGHDVSILDLKVHPDAFEETVHSEAPDLIGFTAMTCEAQTIVRLAKQVKELLPSTCVVVGGVHASCDPVFFNRDCVDWIIIGLGVQSMPELVAQIESKKLQSIPGVCRSTPGQQLRYEQRRFTKNDLLAVPPRYDLVEQNRPHYILNTLKLPLGMVASAAGCPFDCHFCCIKPLTGGQYLTTNVEQVVRDLEAVPTPVVRLVDANTFGSVDHAWKLAEAIGKRDIKKQLIADVRADSVVRHPDLFKRWAEIGLRAVIIGFEEIEDNALNVMNKKTSAKTNEQAIRILHDCNITIVGDFIVSPDYTEENFETLKGYVQEHAIDLPMYAILTPLPGTHLYAERKDELIITDLDYYTLTNAVLPTTMPEDEFYHMYADLITAGHSNAKV